MPDNGSLFHSLKLETYIAIDLETTGLNSDTDKIIEISAYKFINGVPTEEYTKLVNPKVSISKEKTSGSLSSQRISKPVRPSKRSSSKL